MELQLSHNSPINTILSSSSSSNSSEDPSTSRPLYHITTPGSFTRKTTTICRVSDRAAEAYERQISHHSSQLKHQNPKKLPREWDLGLREIARIDWKLFGSSSLVYKGSVSDMDSFMPSKGCFRTTRTFTAPDGKSYSWHLGFLNSRLELNDGSNPPKIIAQQHQRNVLGETKAFLEIDPAGMNILELIVITWVFVEGRRRDMERKYIFGHNDG